VRRGEFGVVAVVMTNSNQMSERKIIQISTVSVSDTDQCQGGVGIHALCDDGSVWELWPGSSGWFRMDDIPQTKDAKKETH